MPEHVNHDVERFVLGALMDAEGQILRSRPQDLIALGAMTPDDFTTPGHRVVFQAIRSLSERARPADASTVFGLCDGMPGAPPFQTLLALQSGNACNREAYLSHAEELRRLSLLRRVQSFAQEQLVKLSKPRPDPAELGVAFEAFAKDFAGATEADETGDSDLIDLLEQWDAAIEGKRQPFVATGVEVLDGAIQGFVPNLNVIGGMPAMGKSALIAEIIMACLERGLKVGLFGLEDGTAWLTKRHLARHMRMPVHAIGSARLAEYQQGLLQAEAGRIAALTRNLLVYRRAGIDPAELVARCKRWVLSHGVQVIFVDHGGEVQHSGPSRDRFDLAVANTYRQLRDLAVNHRVPVVVLCHFNRDTEKELAGVPTMQSFAETEYIARMARLALGLWQKPGDERLRCSVLKRTEGKRGITVAIERDEEFALVKRKGGEEIDLRDEAAAERAAREADKQRKRAPAWKAQLPAES